MQFLVLVFIVVVVVVVVVVILLNVKFCLQLRRNHFVLGTVALRKYILKMVSIRTYLNLVYVHRNEFIILCPQKMA